MGFALIAIVMLAVLAACSDDDDHGGSDDGSVTPAPSGFTFDPEATRQKITAEAGARQGRELASQVADIWSKTTV